MPIFEGEPWHQRWFEAAVRAEIATLTAGDSVAPVPEVAAEQGRRFRIKALASATSLGTTPRFEE